ncbi:MAG: replication-associated recombination protein A [Candidatus Parcubacteria bacterium]|nr:replication-associated recombination protein A [Candidatus Parcubacteria bacterium]
MDLFDKNLNMNAPLADRMRPLSFEEFVGQEQIVGAKTLLRQAIESDNLPTILFWGPPGTGKTTLAKIIAQKTQAVFVPFSAVTSGVKELRETIKAAIERKKFKDQNTILFIDEIHRWNKAQQDALLPYVEKGIVTLIGATTENPSFEVNSALLSRCRVFVLNLLEQAELKKIISGALADKEKGLGNLSVQLNDEVSDYLTQMANGDARTALNALEFAVNSIESGEDPLYIARRLIRFASEDIGLADPNALVQAVSAYTACHYLGYPECDVILAQAVAYLAKAPKDNSLYIGLGQVKADIKNLPNEPVPLHLRNAPTKLMKDLDYGKDYKYTPNYDNPEDAKQDYLPEKLKNKKYLNLD